MHNLCTPSQLTSLGIFIMFAAPMVNRGSYAVSPLLTKTARTEGGFGGVLTKPANYGFGSG